MLQIILTETKQPSGLFWVIYIIILIIAVFLIITPIRKAIKKNKQYKQHQLQLLEEQNRLLREQLNRDK